MRYLVAILLACTFTVPAHAGRKQDRRLLERVKRVDGAGSGLDADTVRGRTPDQMAPDTSGLAARVQALEARLDGGGTLPPPTGGATRDAFYARASRDVRTAGNEKLSEASCNDANDVGVACAGGAYDGSVDYPITWIGIVLGDGVAKADKCLVVVDGRAGTPNMEALVRCLAVP